MSICNFPILFGVCVYVFLCLCVLVNKCMCACQCLFNCTLYFIWERQTSWLSLLWDTCPFILPHLWFICPSGQVASTGRTSESCPLRGPIPPCTAHCSRHFLSRFSGFACSLLWHLSISWNEIFLKLLTSLLCPASECKDPTSETKFLSTFLFHSCLAPFIPPNTNLESRIPFSPGGRPQKLECYYCLRAKHKA